MDIMGGDVAININDMWVHWNPYIDVKGKIIRLPLPKQLCKRCKEYKFYCNCMNPWYILVSKINIEGMGQDIEYTINDEI